MSEKIKKVPKLRFPEFTDTWEQCKLGEVCKITTGKLDANAMVSEGKYDFYTSGIAKYKIDIPAFSGPAITIAGNGATVGYMHLADGDFNAYQRTYVLSNFLEDRQYLFYVIGLKLPGKINQEARTGSIPYIVMDMLTDLIIDKPLNEEQEKIGNFFKAFDDLITIHQRKLENLKKQKKSLLQKMFPKNGSNFPEIRFPEFTDAWEQCKLGEVGEFSKGNGYTKNDLVKIGIPIVLYGQLYTNYETIISNISTFVELKENSIFSTGNELLIPASGETAEDIARASVIKEKNVILGGDLNIIKLNQKINSLFLAFSLSNGELKKELSSKAQGKSIVHLHSSEIKKVNFKYPSLKEQEKIGNFFKSIDEIITIHQRKLENLKKLKKGLLQQMFI
ncbi:MAG: restriction endonuclease subunit S [Fusobacterium gastrosuis]|uniref:restriction endonuclease subunit S n=1 Tax=Fusobacterium gastrosuis TaxID=1755100 RepID=UPI002A992C2A|nr:restriction endonuclease subunit S [Fusobacterium gastrosuis]